MYRVPAVQHLRWLTSLLSMVSMLSLLHVIVESAPSFIKHTQAVDPVVALDTAMITGNMRHWTTDYAVMFYAPWCNHCKEVFAPMWKSVAMDLAREDPHKKRKLVIGMFNCEQDDRAAAFCVDVNLQYYPTFMFFGSGKFYDHDPLSGVLLGGRPTVYDQSVQYPSTALIYPEVIFDWVRTMHFVSGSNRMMERFNLFGRGKGKAAEEQLLAEVEALERQNEQLKDAMARSEGGQQQQQQPYGFGDPFEQLSLVGYGSEFEPVMACVMDMAKDYCDVPGVKEADPWCNTLEHCITTGFEGDECWPSRCPLRDEGCQMTSYCLTPEMINVYVDLFDEAHETKTPQGEAALQDVSPDTPRGIESPDTAGSRSTDTVTSEDGGAMGGSSFFGGRVSPAGRAGTERSSDERGDAVGA